MKKITLEELMAQTYPDYVPESDEGEDEETQPTQIVESDRNPLKQLNVTMEREKISQVTAKQLEQDQAVEESNTKIAEQVKTQLTYGKNAVYYPTHPEQLTELGRQLYELGDIDKIIENCNIEVMIEIDQGEVKVDTITFTPKDGTKLLEINQSKMFVDCGRRSFSFDNTKNNEIFGIPNKYEPLPQMFSVVQTNEHDINERLRRGLQQIDMKSYKLFHCHGKTRDYINLILQEPVVKKKIQEKIDLMDPRLINIEFGVLDSSIQKNRETRYRSLYGDDGVELLHPCKDFELLGLAGGFQSNCPVDDVKNGKFILSYNYKGEYDSDGSNYKPQKRDELGSLEKLTQKITNEQGKLDQFESKINQETSRKRLERYKKLLPFVEKQEVILQAKFDRLNQAKNGDPELKKQLETASVEHPIEFGFNKYDLQTLYHYLKGKTVKLTDTARRHQNFIGVMGGGKEYYVDSMDTKYNFEQNIALHHETKVKFSGDYEYSESTLKALQDAGFTYEYSGRSGFSSRNSYIIQIPKTTTIAHVITFHKGKILYSGAQEIEIVDEVKAKQANEIIQQVAIQENQKKHQKFYDTFLMNSTNGGLSAIVEVGGGPESFGMSDYDTFPQLCLAAKIKTGNTADRRRNMSHEYVQILIDTSKIKKGQILYLPVPEQYRGIVIGKGGSHIKALTEKLGVSKIIIQ